VAQKESFHEYYAFSLFLSILIRSKWISTIGNMKMSFQWWPFNHEWTQYHFFLSFEPTGTKIHCITERVVHPKPVPVTEAVENSQSVIPSFVVPSQIERIQLEERSPFSDWRSSVITVKALICHSQSLAVGKWMHHMASSVLMTRSREPCNDAEMRTTFCNARTLSNATPTLVFSHGSCMYHWYCVR